MLSTAGTFLPQIYTRNEVDNDGEIKTYVGIWKNKVEMRADDVLKIVSTNNMNW